MSEVEIDKLSASELKQLRARINLLLDTDVASSPDEERVIYDALSRASEDLISVATPPFVQFAKSRYYPAYRKGAEELSQYVSRVMPDLSRVERQRAYRVLLRALCRMLSRRKIAPSVGVLARNLHNVSQAVEEAFPGYVESGLLPSIIRTRKKRTKLQRR